MKVACLQLAPEIGKVKENIQRAEEILANTALNTKLDWLILPELAFTGYNFHSLEQITPYLEPTTAGITTQWALSIARQYNCHVTVGYPETTSPSSPTLATNYNSTVTVSPTGTILANYRKSFLYYTDETWSSEGSGFYTGPLGTLSQNVANPNNGHGQNTAAAVLANENGNATITLGICMDINPYKFIAPWRDFEFANAVLKCRGNIVCVSMAWLCTLTPEELMAEPGEPDIATIAYWVERFQPLVEASATMANNNRWYPNGPYYIILANRCGIEGNVCYAGSTTILKIEKGEVKMYERLGKAEEKCLVVDLDERPAYMIRSASQ